MLDSQTTLIMATLLFLVLPAMVWLILPGRTEPDVGMWCLAIAMAGVGSGMEACSWVERRELQHRERGCM